MARGYQPLVAALHVHSRYSNGKHEVLELASYARERKLDVLGITDSFLTRVRYGIPPWRQLLSWPYSRESVMSRGVEEYLQSLREAQSQFPEVLLLPGVEAAPFYYWQGTPGRDLRLFDFDRHLLVFADWDARTWRNLPVIENERWSNTPHHWNRAAGPALLLLAAGVLFAAGRLRARRGARSPLATRMLAPLLLAAGLAWGLDSFPLGSLGNPYAGRHDMGPYQQLIDYTGMRNGAAFWSYPEAGYLDVMGAGATMISQGHPEDLALSDSYRGFEGVYGGKITITQPGALWDQMLMEYLAGGRKTWPSVITGIDFHDFDRGGGWYELDRGNTVIWASSRSLGSVLEALKAGRNYCLFQPVPGKQVVLRDYAVKAAEGAAIAGEAIRTAQPFTVSSEVAWVGVPEADRTFELQVIRNGEVIHQLNAVLPLRVSLQESLPAGKYYYRLRMVLGPHQELLANPIFVEVPQGGGAAVPGEGPAPK